MTKTIIDVDIDEVARLFRSLNDSLVRFGIEPIKYTVVGCITDVYEATGECIDPDDPYVPTTYVDDCDPDTAAANLAEPQSVYDVGDLLAEIDEALGSIIERTTHRYLPKPMAQDMRRKVVKQVADIVVQHGKQIK